jgi:hypothetical protein
MQVLDLFGNGTGCKLTPRTGLGCVPDRTISCFFVAYKMPAYHHLDTKINSQQVSSTNTYKFCIESGAMTSIDVPCGGFLLRQLEHDPQVPIDDLLRHPYNGKPQVKLTSGFRAALHGQVQYLFKCNQRPRTSCPCACFL